MFSGTKIKEGCLGQRSLVACPSIGSDQSRRDRVAFHFFKQTAYFANEQSPTLRVSRCLEAQEGLFKLCQ
jgi:hypothetical protein